MKKYSILFLFCWCISNSIHAQRVGIGTTTPNARLAVDSSIMLDQLNTNQGALDKGSLLFGGDGRVGISRSFLTGSTVRSGLSFFTGNTRRMVIDSTGQVGIGTSNPLQALHVNGSAYIGYSLGLGSSNPTYAFENYSGYNYMYYSLGIGTTPSSSYLLDVSGSDPSRFRGALQVDGSLTVNSGKGVAYNSTSAAGLKIYPFTTATFYAVLGGHQLSAEGAISFYGGFTGTPRVFVGDIDVTGGTAGELYRVQLQLYGCSTISGLTTCKARLLNTSPNPVNYSITWNCYAIGN